DRRRPGRQGGHVPHLLVLARFGARHGRRTGPSQASDGPTPSDLLAARPVRRGVRGRHEPPPRELPAGVLASRDDPGCRPHHPPRADRGVHVTDAYDVIIIGTGAGGGTLARQLAPWGQRILLLERGDWLPREPSNWDTAEVFVHNRYVSPDTWTTET